MPWGKTGYLKYIPSTTWQSAPQLERVLGESRDDAVVVDLGAGGRRVRPGAIAVDFLPVEGCDLCADVEHLPFADDTVDLVIGTGLLEHVRDERRLMEEIARVLRPGGTVHLEVPFLQQYHDDPIDCRRFTRPGLEDLCTHHGLEPARSGVHIGPTVTVLTLIKHYLAFCLEGEGLIRKAASAGAFGAVALLAWPARFIDRALVKKPGAHRLAFGVFCTARKAAAAPGAGPGGPSEGTAGARMAAAGPAA